MQAGPIARAPRAFALVEIVVSAVIVGVLLALFALAAADSRRNASLDLNINNLKQHAWASAAYFGDCNERFWTFSWTRADHPPPYNPPDDLAAAAEQAGDIIRRRALPTYSTTANWAPHVLYSHLVLADHLNLPLPTPWMLSPLDDTRAAWYTCAARPPGLQQLSCFLALPLSMRPGGGSSNDLMRSMVSSSYDVGTAFYSQDQRVGSLTTVQSALTDHYSYLLGTAPLGGRRITEVAFPSRKVMLWDQYQRHFGKRVAHAQYTEARVPLLLVDGSVGVRSSSESNPGFYPNIPTNALPLRFVYEPRSWEPAKLTAGQNLLTGYYRWTRGGLRGVDLGAPEVCTGQDGCTP